MPAGRIYGTTQVPELEQAAPGTATESGTVQASAASGPSKQIGPVTWQQVLTPVRAAAQLPVAPSQTSPGAANVPPHALAAVAAGRSAQSGPPSP